MFKSYVVFSDIKIYTMLLAHLKVLLNGNGLFNAYPMFNPPHQNRGLRALERKPIEDFLDVHILLETVYFTSKRNTYEHKVVK